MQRFAACVITIIFLYQPLAFAEISLTASDGSGLELKKFNAKVVLEGLFAFTEIELTFHNPENRSREGRFQITLPQGAAISRFAMSRDNQLLEGEVVERKLAQRAYEDFLHQRQDPALLEVDQGNRFNARVFPIFPHEVKRIIVSYSETLTSGRYLLPLRDLPKLEKFSLRILFDSNNFESKNGQIKELSGFNAQMSRNQIIKVDQHNYKPENDFEMPVSARLGSLAVRSQNLVASRLVPFPVTNLANSHRQERWVVLVDTSASQSPYVSHTLDKLIELKKELPISSWQVFSFDQVFRVHENLTQIKDIEALGSSDLEQAINHLSRYIEETSRLLIVSDMVATSGEIEIKKLGKMLSDSHLYTRVDVLIPSSHHDYSMANILRQSGGNAGAVANLKRETIQLVRKLLTPIRSNIEINVMGSKWYWPRTIDAIQDGEAITIFAELPVSQPIKITIADQSFSPPVQQTETLLLKREWARARVNRLSELMFQASDNDMTNALRQQIIKVSVDERIITPYTALLVLESKVDYERFGIQQQAMANILSIGLEGVTVLNRTPISNIATMTTTLEKDEVVVSNEDSQRKLSKSKVSNKEVTAGLPLSDKTIPALSIAAKPANIVELAEPPEQSQDQEKVQQRRRIAPMARISSISDRAQEAPAVASATQTSSEPNSSSPWIGEYKKFREMLTKKKLSKAEKLVLKWRKSRPQDVMAFIARGEYFEAKKDFIQASRAYGSLIDYFPARADIRRWAAGRLLRFNAGYALALDSLNKAVAQRPDHPSGHYLLAWANWLLNKNETAENVLRKAIGLDFSRFAGATRILKESLALIQGKVNQDQLRFVMTWETDANDVDFHVRDSKNNHAYYGHPSLPTGGRLYFDITTGYGPENFTITKPKYFPYKLSAHYYSMGAMGYGMGVLSIVSYQARSGNISLDFRPYVVMKNQAFVDLGEVKADEYK